MAWWGDPALGPAVQSGNGDSRGRGPGAQAEAGQSGPLWGVLHLPPALGGALKWAGTQAGGLLSPHPPGFIPALLLVASLPLELGT